MGELSQKESSKDIREGARNCQEYTLQFRYKTCPLTSIIPSVIIFLKFI